MVGFIRRIWCALAGVFRSRASLEAEILVLRHQLNILRRRSPKRPVLSNFDRLIFAGLYSIAPKALSALAIVKPETVIRWHRRSFRLYWRWKSKSLSGRCLRSFAPSECFSSTCSSRERGLKPRFCFFGIS